MLGDDVAGSGSWSFTSVAMEPWQVAEVRRLELLSGSEQLIDWLQGSWHVV